MRNSSLLRNLRTLMLAVLTLGVMAAVGGLIYLNEIGLTDDLRSKVSKELSSHGIHAEFDSLRFDLLRGISARNVTVYSDADHTEQVAHFPRMSVSMDKTKALRGKVRLERVTCEDGSATITIFRDTPEQRSLQVAAIETDIRFHRGNVIEIDEFTAQLERTRIALSGTLIRPPQKKREDTDPPVERKSQAQNIAAIIDEVLSLQLPDGAEYDPVLEARLDGDIGKPEQIRAEFALTVPRLQRADYSARDLSLSGTYESRVLAIEELKFANETGGLTIDGTYDGRSREGYFHFSSSLDIQDFAKRVLDQDILPELKIQGESALSGDVTLQTPANGAGLKVKIIGECAARDIAFRDLSFSDFETQFSWAKDGLFLRNINARNEQGGLNGRFLMRGKDLQYEAVTTLPISLFRNFFPHQNTRRIIDRFTPGEATTSKITLAGRGTIGQPETWQTRGSSLVTDFQFNKVPLKRLAIDFTFLHRRSLLENVEADFDYTDSPWRKKYGGPQSARATAPMVEIDSRAHLVRIPSVQGTIWPEHALSMFLKDAPKFTSPYRFHSPPTLSGTGQFSTRRDEKKTDFTVAVTTKGQTDWDFLDKPLPLQNVSTRLRFRHGLTEVLSLNSSLFDGTLGLNLRIAAGKDQPTRVAGAVALKDIGVKGIASLYKIDAIDTGSLDGSMKFTIIGGKANTLQGNGNFALTNTKLFSVPVFGPLSPLISGLLSDKRAGYERAKKARLTTVIEDGVAHFNDFNAVTRSLRFTGEGALDFTDSTFGMTLRMNGRGLLKLLDIPLAPLYGLFQFTGNGTLSTPEWKNTPFVRPSAEREKFLITE